MGTILIVVLLEAVRRSMGWPLPVIALLFIGLRLFRPRWWIPTLLVQPGADWSGLVNHLYLTSQGIYGTALWVIATYVFHFVLFGVLATRIGLGQLFIDLASAVAGRLCRRAGQGLGACPRRCSARSRARPSPTPSPPAR